MAEEVQLPECNGDRHPEATPITNLIDIKDTVTVCEMREGDPVTPSDIKEGSGNCLDDKIDSLEIKKGNTEEEKGDSVPAHDSPCQEETNSEANDDPTNEHTPSLSETREEEVLTETEEENTSIETDNDQGSCDEEESGPGSTDSRSPSGSQLESNSEQGSRPDISRNSYSRYDTVSYRKIRRGNTKQRIDEFESMMN